MISQLMINPLMIIQLVMMMANLLEVVVVLVVLMKLFQSKVIDHALLSFMEVMVMVKVWHNNLVCVHW